MQTSSQSSPLAAELTSLAADRDLRLFSCCDSTNRVARRALDEGAGPGLIVVAESQTAGRGRLGRSWESEPGANLLFSLVLRPQVPGEEVARCVLLWAAAMAEVLDCRLKWPNDLQDSEERKLGGILAELYTREGTAPEDWRVILGVGLNINQVDFPGLPQATSLRRMRGEIQSRARLLEELLPAIEAVDPRAPGILDRWRARSNTLGRHVRVGEHQGLAESLREDGALVVGGHPVLAGDVELLADPASSTAC